MVWARRTLVYLGYFLAIILFITLAAYAVLIASGYKINWQEKTLTQTGVLAINSSPGRATVTLNGKTLSRLTPLSLKYLLPGEYEVRIEKEGFLPYRNRVEVKTKLITDLRETLLFLEEPPSEEIELAFAPRAVVAFGRDQFLLADDQGRVFLWEGQKAVPFLAAWPKNLSFLKEMVLSEAKASASGKTAVLFFTQGQNKRFVVWQNGKPPRLLDKVAPSSLTEVEVEDDRLYFFAQNAIWALELKNFITQAIFKNALGFGFSDGKFLTVQKDTAGQLKWLELSSQGGVLRELTGDLPVANHYRFFHFGDYGFVTARTSRASTLWFYPMKNGGSFEKLISDFTGSVWESNKHLIYQSTTALYAFNRETKEQAQIISLATPITFIGSFRRNLFFLQGSALRTVDLLGGGLNTLLTLEPAHVFVSPDAKEAYALVGGKLTRYQLRAEN